MRLRRIEIAHFRKLMGPVVLDELSDGLVVISGDNEEGKSTILAALKAAFFEHHQTGGAVREAMAPHRGGVPEIAVAFEVGGQMHRLRKAFRRGGVVLETPAQRLQDDAAERRLQELLRFERRQGRGRSLPENAGLQSLFWVDQATTFQGFEAVAGGRERLAAAIAAEIGTIAGGERSRRLLSVANEHAAKFYTAERKHETGALKAATDRLRALEAENEALEARRNEFDTRVDRLARLRDGRRRLIEQDAAGRVRARCEALRRQLGELADLERRGELVVAGLKAAAAERARIEAQQRDRRRLIEDEARLASGRREMAARIAAVEGELEVLRQGEAAARRAEAAAAEAVAAVERSVANVQGWGRVARLDAENERLRAALARCSVAADARLGAQAALASNLATPERVAAVRARQQDCETASARMAAAATRLEFHGDGGKPVIVDGLAVDPAAPLLLTERAELTLGGFGQLVVIPGGEGLGQRQEAVRAATAALTDALAAAGAPSLAEAEAALERRRVAEAEFARADADRKAVLQAFAVGSVEALAQLLANQEAERVTQRDQLDPMADGGDAAALEREAALRADALTQARTALEAARDTLAKAMTEAAGLKGEQTVAGLRATEVRERLAVAREQLADDVLAAALAAAVERHGAAQDQQERIGRELQAGDADGLRERLAMADRELATLDGERQQLDAEIRDLEVALREAGAGDWVERQDEVTASLTALRAEHARLELEGRAWKLLADKLTAADQSLREKLVAPISQRLRPLLQRVFPGADAVFDPDALSLTHLRRDGVEESYGSLSIGAREQLAVLVRLAFAGLLTEREGEAPCLILDDALVYADETQFDAMKGILQRMARDMQIVVLTCRPRDYYGLEAHYLRLDDCRVS